MFCLCHNCPTLLRFWFQNDLGRENSAIYLKIQAGGRSFLTIVTHLGHALRPIFMLWLLKIWQMSSRGKFMQHLEACLLWQLKLTKFCVSLRCLDVQNELEIQLLSKVFCYSWLVCLLGFWLRSTSLVKVGNPISDGLVFVFHLRPCLMRKRV